MSFSRPGVGLLWMTWLSPAVDGTRQTSEQGPRGRTGVRSLLSGPHCLITGVPASRVTGLPGGSHRSCPPFTRDPSPLDPTGDSQGSGCARKCSGGQNALSHLRLVPPGNKPWVLREDICGSGELGNGVRS